MVLGSQPRARYMMRFLQGVLEPLHRARPFGQGSAATHTAHAFGSKGCVQLVHVMVSQYGLLPGAA